MPTGTNFQLRGGIIVGTLQGKRKRIAMLFDAPQIKVISALWDGRERTVDEVSRRAGIPKGTVVRAAQSLIRDKWVTSTGIKTTDGHAVRAYRLGERGRRSAGVKEPQETP